MTIDQFEKSIREKRLVLTFSEKLTHFMIVIFILIIPISFISLRAKSWLRGESTDSLFEIATSIIVPAALAWLFFIWQNHKLTFTTLITSLPHNALEHILVSTAKENDWEIVQNNKHYFVAKIKDSLGTGIWGSQLTVLFNQKEIMINCICDPDKKSTITSYGKNKKNVSILVANLSKANT